MKQKIITFLLLLGFLFLFGYVYSPEYFEFHQQQQNQNLYKNTLQNQNTNFSLENIENFSSPEDQILIFPSLSYLEQFESQIDAAKDKIYLETYIFTEKKMRAALIRAKKRGVEVKVILENNPYQAPYLNDDAYKELENAGISVHWSDPLIFSLNHSKLLIIDSTVYVSTGNFSYSLFKTNRDFMFFSKNSERVKDFESVFLSDFSGESFPKIEDYMLISPDNSRKKLEFLLQNAQERIDFYFPYFSDASLEKIFLQLGKSGIKIRGITEKDFYTENPEMMQKYKENSVLIAPLKHLHGKAILIDHRYLYIGSINFSDHSLDENREMGIITTNTNIIEAFSSQFERDFSY